MRVLRVIGAPLVACLAAASVLAVVNPGQAGAADPPPPKKFVTGWLPYWNTSEATSSVVDNANVFQDASPFVFDANSKTDIALTADTDEWRYMRRSLNRAGVANIPTVATDLTADQFARILKNRDRRIAHARALVNVVDRYNLDGIDLDYESINFGSTSAKSTVRRYYPTLLAELNARLDRMGAVTSVTVAARTSRTDPNWWVFNYPALGRAADRVRIMTYDFHWSGGSPGPIAPKWWVNDVASYASSVIASRKISMGMPAYGRDWFGKKLSGTCPGKARETVSRTTQQMRSFARSIGVTPEWKERGTSQRFTYVRKYSGGGDPCRVKRVVWFDDARSLETKAPLVEEYDLRGVAIWALGNEGSRAWPLLRQYGRALATG